MKQRAFKVGKFLAAGVPAGLLAIPMNYLLVENAHLHKSAAYAIVLLFQVTTNFFLCRFLVFEKSSKAPIRVQFVKFMGGILTFRLADWAIYSLLVGFFGNYFLVLQIINAMMFAWLKFRFSERVMEGREENGG